MARAKRSVSQRDGVAQPRAVVEQLHHRGDRGVEREPAQVAADLVDRPVRLAQQLEIVALRRAAAPDSIGVRRRRPARRSRPPGATAGRGSGAPPRRPRPTSRRPGRAGRRTGCSSARCRRRRARRSRRARRRCPCDLLIFAPSFVTMPCVNSASNGSWKSRWPRSASALVKKRAYIRCRIACSTPPMYWSTGIHSRSAAGSHAAWSLRASQ